MKHSKCIYRTLSMSLLVLMASDLIAAEADSGFLTDYTQLEPVAGNDARLYIAPNALKNCPRVIIVKGGNHLIKH